MTHFLPTKLFDAKYIISFIKMVLVILATWCVTACEKEPAYKNTKELLEAMKAKNDDSWYQHFTFKQRTLFFDKGGLLTDSAVWHEAVSYPYLFRIDRDLTNGNYTIYRSDSTYHFKNDSLAQAISEPATHLLYKGGLYFVTLEEVLEKLTKYGFNTTSFRRDTFMNEPAFVIGDDNQQFWLHATKFYCMRRISTPREDKILDIVYDDFVPLGKGWVEQKVTFYFDGTKRMEEFYFDIQLKENIDRRTYAIHDNYKWYLQEE